MGSDHRAIYTGEIKLLYDTFIGSKNIISSETHLRCQHLIFLRNEKEKKKEEKVRIEVKGRIIEVEGRMIEVEGRIIEVDG